MVTNCRVLKELFALYFMRTVRENSTVYICWKGAPLTPFCGAQYQYHIFSCRTRLLELSECDYFRTHLYWFHEDADGKVKMRDNSHNLQLDIRRPPHNPRSPAQPLRNPSL